MYPEAVGYKWLKFYFIKRGFHVKGMSSVETVIPGIVGEKPLNYPVLSLELQYSIDKMTPYMWHRVNLISKVIWLPALSDLNVI